MKRRVYILSLLSVFFISTTGLPLTVSMCSMDDMHTTEHCGTAPQKMVDHSCCSKDNVEPAVNIKMIDHGSCCQFKVVDNNISDKYLTSTNDAGFKSPVKIILVLNFSGMESQTVPPFNILTSSSPPPLSDNHIYLSNSVFLI